MPTVSSSISSPEAEAAAPAPAEDVDTPPPFLGSWRNVYLLLAAELFVTVAIFWALTRWAA